MSNSTSIMHIFVLCGLIVAIASDCSLAGQTDIVGPPGGGAFGTGVTVLSNGNFTVTDPGYDAPGPVVDVGAVYLYSPEGALISTMTGSTAGDQVGSGGVGFSTGIYWIRSPNWDNGAAVDAGAVTWGNLNTGVSGVVSAANSLFGGTSGDQVGSVRGLSNGNLVVLTPDYDNGSIVNAGAVTWVNGTTGTAGVVSSSNSLVGSTTEDRVGNSIFDVLLLTNGNYVILTRNWDNGPVANVGAATWCNGSTGTTGPVSAANSLIGSTAEDQVGTTNGVPELSNGNYVVVSRNWDNGAIVDAGAVTWCNGATGTIGVVSTANSLVGTKASDQVGNGGARALTNGNYTVLSPNWDNGGVVDTGAVTWGNGTTGIVGAVSASNSLVGTTASDLVGNLVTGVTPLTNGNYVVISSNWDNGGTVNAGAVTWGNGTTGITGPVFTVNSLVGSTASDLVGGASGGVTALSNGNYVVRSNKWDNVGAIDSGAVTWGNGTTGISGAVSMANSLVGGAANHEVGGGTVMALTNGSYVVRSPNWDNGAVTSAGAVTWCNGATGTVGVVSAANSLVGSTANDQIGGSSGGTELSNGNYMISSPQWDNGGVVNAGAVTWCSGGGDDRWGDFGGKLAR